MIIEKGNIKWVKVPKWVPDEKGKFSIDDRGMIVKTGKGTVLIKGFDPITVLESHKAHKKRHEELHKSLDELFADYILHHPKELELTNMPLNKLLEWSFEQTKKPTPYK
jgi:hypothetical protein